MTTAAATLRSRPRNVPLALVGVLLFLFGAALLGWQIYDEYHLWQEARPVMRQLGWEAYIEQKPNTLNSFPAACFLDARCRPVFRAVLAQGRELWSWWWAVGLAGFTLGLGFVWVGATREELPTFNAHYLTPREARRHKVFIELQKSTMLQPQLALAKYRRRLVGVKSVLKGKRRSMLPHGALIAATQSGKSLIAKQTALSFPGSMVIVDVKGELFRETAGFRARLGPVYVLDATSGRGHQYDPVSDVQTSEHDLSVLAEVLVQHDESNLASADFTRRATSAVKAALYAARVEKRAPIPYLLEVTQDGLEAFVTRLTALEPANTPGPIRSSLTAFLSKPPEAVEPKAYEEMRGYLPVSWAIITGNLETFRDHQSMMSRSDFSARELAERRATVYLIWPTKLLGDKSSIPLKLILSTLINTLTDDANRLSKEEIDERIQTLLLLDELPQYAFATLPKQIAVARSAKVAAMIVCQSFSQLSNSFGQRNAQTILDNCDYKVVLRPDGEVAKWLEEELGKVSVTRQRTSHSRGQHGHSETRSEGEVVRPLETYDELRVSSEDTAFVLVRGVPPIKGKKLLPHLDPILKKRGQTPPPYLTPYPAETEGRELKRDAPFEKPVAANAGEANVFVDPDDPNG